MDEITYRAKLKDLEEKFKKDKNDLAKEFALSNSPVKTGEIFTDHLGSILVEKIQIYYSTYNNLPECVYYGLELKKDGTPKKSNVKRQAWQSNMVKNK